MEWVRCVNEDVELDHEAASAYDIEAHRSWHRTHKPRRFSNRRERAELLLQRTGEPVHAPSYDSMRAVLNLAIGSGLLLVAGVIMIGGPTSPSGAAMHAGGEQERRVAPPHTSTAASSWVDLPLLPSQELPPPPPQELLPPPHRSPPLPLRAIVATAAVSLPPSPPPSLPPTPSPLPSLLPSPLPSLPPPSPPPSRPPSPPPPSLPPALPPSPARLSPRTPKLLGAGWVKIEGKNCWWDGHGAEEVDSPKGSVVAGATTVEQCKAACIELGQGYPHMCEGILVQQTADDSRRCFRKAQIDISMCSDDETFELYVRSDRPPLPPLPPPYPYVPPSPPLQSLVDRVNGRFHRSPYEEGLWHTLEEGALADAGVLIHLFDRWEEHADGRYHYWHADESLRPDLSCSLIWAGQRAQEHPRISIPVYNGAHLEGVVLRPGPSTKIRCGTATDTGGGECKSLCPQPPAFHVDTFDPWAQGRDGGCYPSGSWRARDFGTYLHRYMRWQTEVQARGNLMDYNEIPVEGRHWNAHLPTTIEAFFGGATAMATRDEFLERFDLAAHEYPLMTLDKDNWEAPFALSDVV